MSALEEYKAYEALHSIEESIRRASREALAEHEQTLRRAGLIDELAHLRRALLMDDIKAIEVLKRKLQQEKNQKPWWMLKWLASPFL